MASGSGKNQDDPEAKEPVDSLRLPEESNAATSSSSSSATESPSFAPQSEIIEDEVHGPPEAGGRNPYAAATTAAAAEQKGEETTSLFWSAWGSADGKPPLPPRPRSVCRARGPSSAGGEEVLASVNPVDLEDVFNELILESKRERSGETDQKAEEGMPRQQNEQVKSRALWPKKDKKPLWRKVKSPKLQCKKGKKLLWRKCHFPGRKTLMVFILLIFLILLLPVQTEAFQRFENIGDAARKLATLNNLEDLLLQFEQETPVPEACFNFFLHPVMIAIWSFLLAGLFSWFIDP